MLSSERLRVYLPEFALLENGRVCLCDFKAHALLCTRRDHFLKKATLAQMPVCRTDERETQGTPRVTRCLPGHALRAPVRCWKQPPRRQGWVPEWRRPCSHCSFTPHLTVLLKSHPLVLLVIENRNRQGFPFLGCPGRKAGPQSREKAEALKHSAINESTRCVPGSVLSALGASSYLLLKCI